MISLGWVALAFFILYILTKRSIFGEIGLYFLAITLVGLSVSYIDSGRYIQTIGLISGAVISVLVSRNISIDDISSTLTGLVIILGILLPVYTIEPISNYIIRMTASDTVSFLRLLGVEDVYVNEDVFVLFQNSGLRTEIILACSGIGSISGVIAYISGLKNQTLIEKLLLSVSLTGIIYGLNTVRNMFIAYAYGHQIFHYFPSVINRIYGRSDEWVSYYIADRIIGQFFSILAIGCILYIFHRYSENRIINEWVDILDQFIS